MRFVQSLLCSTRKSTSDSTIFTKALLLLSYSLMAKTCLRSFSGVPNSTGTLEIGQKFRVWCKQGSRHPKLKSRSRGFNSRAFCVQLRLVIQVINSAYSKKFWVKWLTQGTFLERHSSFSDLHLRFSVSLHIKMRKPILAIFVAVCAFNPVSAADCPPKCPYLQSPTESGWQCKLEILGRS